MTSTEKPFPWKCGHCRQKAVTRSSIAYTVDALHDGRTYTVTIPDLSTPVCGNCGEIILDDSANRRITESLREQIGLLSPEQIRAGRDTLGLTHEEFASLLRVPGDAVACWESGTVLPTRAVDLLMRVVFEFVEVRSVLADDARLRKLGEVAA